ncbi:MAG TPA: sortase [Acidimicrobiales bacterium]|nr:sortase [Acidimicrobiales bacterium]
MDALIRYFRRHRWARRSLTGLSVMLILAAVGLLAYPLYTNVRQDRIQHRLVRQIATPELEQRYRTRSLREGDALTKLKIPKLGVNVTVVEGVSASALRAGAGHYPQTPLPCDEGNVAIAGHRTTYGKPMANVDQLVPGDVVILETPVGSCTYEVSQRPFITHPEDAATIADDPSQRMLTMTTCHPKGSAAQRLIVKAKMTRTGTAQA